MKEIGSTRGEGATSQLCWHGCKDKLTSLHLMISLPGLMRCARFFDHSILVPASLLARHGSTSIRCRELSIFDVFCICKSAKFPARTHLLAPHHRHRRSIDSVFLAVHRVADLFVSCVVVITHRRRGMPEYRPD